MEKFYVKHGIPGYGPDLDSEDEPYSFEDLADVLSEELRHDANYAEEAANALADAGQFEDAWKEHKLAESLDILARNFDTKRKDAPLYKDRPQAWNETVERLITQNFPVDVAMGYRLYVWEANEDDD